jgi:hypothetical protein
MEKNIDKKVFIHIPKNGGFTLHKCPRVEGFNNPRAPHLKEDYLKDLKQYSKGKPHSVGVGHCRWKDLKPERTNDAQCVAIVRNPWSKMVSHYMFKHRKMIRENNYNFEQLSKNLPESFEDFLELRNDILENTDYNWHRTTDNWSLQKDYVTDEEGILKCDILRFEHYDEDTMKYFNLDEPIPRGNVTNGKVNDKGEIINKIDYRYFYNDINKKIIEEWFKEDIDYFGFTFDGSATKNIWNK